jgi:hypothetical protein
MDEVLGGRGMSVLVGVTVRGVCAVHGKRNATGSVCKEVVGDEISFE